MENIGEACGVFGVLAAQRKNVAQMVYTGLFALQHRGQESAGIVVSNNGVFYGHKDVGLVGDVFTEEALAAIPEGNLAVGHVRYGTTGGNSRANCQPIEVRHRKGWLAIAHNGNLTNALALRDALEGEGAIFHTTSDTEVIAYEIVRERLTAPSIEEAAARALRRVRGAFSLAIASPRKLIGVRDPFGFRPLCLGQTPEGDWVVASESCALTAVGAAFVRDVAPGEMVVISPEGLRSFFYVDRVPERRLCLFEFIYFARPDSVIDDRSVYEARLEMGARLAQEAPADADVVIGAPDSGLVGAMGYARATGISYAMGLVRNRYVGRTFINPGQLSREAKVRVKLAAVDEVVRGRRVVLVDDSIVRGTTSRSVIDLLRRAGAKEVHMRVLAPPFLHPCCYGTDIDREKGLIAANHSLEEISAEIGADSLAYLSMLGALAAVGRADCCTACFSGQYPDGAPESSGKSRFEMPIAANTLS